MGGKMRKKKIKILSLGDIFHYVEVKKKRKVPFSNRSMELRSLRERERERKYLTNKHEDDARFNPVINME